MKKKILCLAIAAVMAAGIVETAYAEEFKSEKDWYVNFDGERPAGNHASGKPYLFDNSFDTTGFFIAESSRSTVNGLKIGTALGIQ